MMLLDSVALDEIHDGMNLELYYQCQQNSSFCSFVLYVYNSMTHATI